MCSLNNKNFGDDGDTDYMTPQVGKVLSEPKGVCHKCGQDGEIYKLHFREAECKSCFIQYVNHKFRATVGSSKLLPRNAVILLAFDGSAEAIVLLDMLQKAQLETSFKRLCCEFKILFIDDYKLTNRSLNAVDYNSYIKTVQKFLFKYEGVKSYIINLRCKDQLPFDIDNIEAYLARETDKEKMFASNFYRIQTTTSRNEFIRMHRNKLIASMSQYLNCRYVFIPSISINVAADLLSSIVLGHGNNAALDVAFLDDRLGNGIKLMRPIKDLSQSEVILYVRARNLKILKTPPDVPSFGCENSLQSITELFIQDLQKNFKSTVSTIFRTGSKIAPNNYPNPEGREHCIQNSENQSNRYDLCRICNSLLLAESKTILAVEYSRYVSKEVISPIKSLPDYKEFLNCKSKQGESLCHRCENMQRDCEVNLM